MVQNPDPQVRVSRAGVGIAAPIYILLLRLSLVIAEAKRHDEGVPMREPLPDAAGLHDFGRPAAADFRHGHPIMCADPAKASYNIWIR